VKFSHAIVRKPGEDFAQGITTGNLGIPDYELMQVQHEAYIQTLFSLGLTVITLEPLPNFPDAYFVEDTAVVTPQVAVITYPGVKTRQGEEDSIASVLSKYRSIIPIQPPGTVDGGDVLMIGDYFFIGLSKRTNQDGAAQLGTILERFGYTWTAVPVHTGLHLKSSVSLVSLNTVLITEEMAQHQAFKRFDKIILDPDEEQAANTLWINDVLIVPTGFPRTHSKLDKLGLNLIELDMSEARKMDGGLSCMSLRF
jgi:dimethylargininase